MAVNTSFFSMNSTPANDVDVDQRNYAEEYTAVFGESPAAKEVTRVFVNFGKAIAAYETSW